MLAIINDTGILVVLVAVVLLFGAARIPKLARNLGEAGREFRKAHDEFGDHGRTPSAPAVALTAARSDGETVTLSRADLDALIADRRDGGPAAPTVS